MQKTFYGERPLKRNKRKTHSTLDVRVKTHKLDDTHIRHHQESDRSNRYKKGKCLFLYGCLGTGTFVTLYHALKEVQTLKLHTIVYMSLGL